MKKLKACAVSLLLILSGISTGHAYTYSFDIQSGAGLLYESEDFSEDGLADQASAGTRLSYTTSMDLGIGSAGFLNIGFSEQGLSMDIFQGINATDFTGSSTDPGYYSGNRLFSAEFDPCAGGTLAYSLTMTPDALVDNRYAVDITTLLFSGGNSSEFIEGLFNGLLQSGTVPIGISTPIEGQPLSISGFISAQGTSAETTATPVPSALWLMGSGLVGLIGLRRRQ